MTDLIFTWKGGEFSPTSSTSLTVVDEQVALQGEGGAEQSFALLTLEGSFLGVGLWEEQGMCKQSRLAQDNDDDADGRRSCVFGRLTGCSKAAQRGLKVQSASVFLPLPLPSKPCPTCPSEWHLNPQSKHGGPQGWSRPQTPQIPTSKETDWSHTFRHLQ